MRHAWLLVVLLGGCRAVLGVEDLVLDEDGGSDRDAATEAGDAGTDSGPTSEGGTDAATTDAFVNTCLTAVDCRKCCRETQPYAAGFPTLQDTAKQQGCICNPAASSASCQDLCATQACATPPQKPEMACGKCIDDLYKSAPASCTSALDSCRQNATCAAALGCMQTCP